MAEQTTAEMKGLLQNIEVDKIGVARLEDWKDTPLWDRARKLLPGAKSIIVLALEIFPEAVKYTTSQAQVGELALRDIYNRHTELVGGRLDWEAYKIVKQLHRLGFKGLSLTAGGAPFDSRLLTGTLSYRHAAQAAGFGATGWHGLLITPEYGSRIRLACVVTDAPLPPSPPASEALPCPECGGACIKICPAGALARPPEGEDHRIDKYACGTYYTASEGCAQCLKVCPAGKSR